VFVGSYAFEVVLYFELLHVSSLGLMNHMNIVLKFLIVFYNIIWNTDTPRIRHVPVLDTCRCSTPTRHMCPTPRRHQHLWLYWIMLCSQIIIGFNMSVSCPVSVLQFIFAHTLNYERWWWQLCLFCSMLWLWCLQLWPT
jgi:hypothetical protein